MPPSPTDALLPALQDFARAVQHHTTLATRIDAQPEDQLKRSVPTLLQAAGQALGWHIAVVPDWQIATALIPIRFFQGMELLAKDSRHEQKH